VTDDEIRNAKVILWRGHCSVHQQFRPEHIDVWRKHHPDVNILVHPECMMDVVDKADYVGSTSYIIKTVEAAPPGSKWAIGTEMHMVNRLKQQQTNKMVELLSPFSCLCSTMYRISPLDLANVLENLAEGRVINQIFVPEDIQKNAKLALDRMLAIPK
jgi:quinolinate synthase